MLAHHFTKPENILKRAEEIILVGEKTAALELLWGMLRSRRHKQYQKTHELAMKRLVDLCIELRDHRTVKNALNTYSEICQQQDPKSLGIVVEYLLSTAESRVRDAGTTVEIKTIASEIEDLENDTTPESVLLDAVTSEGTRDRTEREYLIPWVKFLWESYRTVLDLLRNTPNVDGLYHLTAHRAFKFSLDYQRSTEFRRLCDILRKHLEKGPARNSDQRVSKDGSVILSPEAMELHLATRFEQLKVATALKLWLEGFRTIEDIHQIMENSAKKPSPQLMATYYQKLVQLFLVSGNLLFHAYAFKAFYFLSKEKNKSLTSEQAEFMANGVLLAALSVPLPSSKSIKNGEGNNHKQRNMAQLLGFAVNPRKDVLIAELISHGILDCVSPLVKELYQVLEVDFDPLSLVQRALPLVSELRAVERYNAYALPIERLIVVRLLSQLSKVYTIVRLTDFYELLNGISLSKLDIEKVVINAVNEQKVDTHKITIDHLASCIRFGEDAFEEPRTRNLLMDVSNGLQAIVMQFSSTPEKRREERLRSTRMFLSQISEEQRQIAQRKALIDARRSELENLKTLMIRQAKDQELREQRAKAELEARKLEAAARERALREAERMKAIQDAFIASSTQKVTLVGVAQKPIETDAERKDLIEKKKKEALEQAMEVERKLQAQSKRLDTLVRALREKERLVLLKQFKEEAIAEEKNFMESLKGDVAAASVKHEEALRRKAELSILQPLRVEFEKSLIPVWKKDLEDSRALILAEIESRKRANKLERARRRKAEHDAQVRFQKQQEREAELEAERERLAQEQEQQEIEAAAAAAAGTDNSGMKNGDKAKSTAANNTSSEEKPKWKPRFRLGEGESNTTTTTTTTTTTSSTNNNSNEQSSSASSSASQRPRIGGSGRRLDDLFSKSSNSATDGSSSSNSNANSKWRR